MASTACIDDRLGFKLVLIRPLDIFTKLNVIWADSGYSGAPPATWVRTVAGITLEFIARPVAHRFQGDWTPLGVQHSNGWLMRYQRLCRHYERCNTNAEAMVR